MCRIAVYPGTFDPITNGHLDLMKRCLRLFDKVIIAVAHNPRKKPLFPLEERVGFIIEAADGWENITVEPFNNLLIEFVRDHKAQVIVKGLRAVSDFEYELQLSSMNRKLDNNIETVFMMPSDEHSFLSSRMIKEIASLGGDIGEMVPETVVRGLKRMFHL